jgi:8-oxo-dGTP diphosphatase
MLKRYGTPPKRGIPYTRRPGAYVILPIGYGILLTYQDGEEREFQLPGGGVDAGEHPIKKRGQKNKRKRKRK